ncbi:mycofactocin system glycosyltransferase [compost metagenome]
MSHYLADVSVVIPCFRCTSTIERAVQSVANQSLRPAEVILVEDCSGDGTLEALYKLKSIYPEGWITVIPLARNGGPGTARNAGWQSAKNSYVAFLDADDSWHPSKLEVQYGWMVDHPDVCLTGHDCTLAGKVTEEVVDVRACETIEVGRRKLLLSNQFPTRSVMLKSKTNQRFKEGKRYCEDHLLWLQVCFNGQKCFKIKCALAFTHRPEFSEGGLSGNLWKMQVGEMENYSYLHKGGYISYVEYAFWTCFSLVKFSRRFIFSRFFRK